MNLNPTWSFSKIKNFETCPKQYYHVHVLKEYPHQDTPATLYGTAFHKVCEDYIRDGTPLDEGFKFFEPALEILRNMPGEKHCELKMGLTANLEPCGFFDEDVWFRGIADLLIINDDRAYCVDYKTGKSAKYADPGQLELMALCVFKHFPQVTQVWGRLLFVMVDTAVSRKYAVTEETDLWVPWLKRHAQLIAAHEHDVWNAKPSGLCTKFCPVVSCPHNGGG